MKRKLEKGQNPLSLKRIRASITAFNAEHSQTSNAESHPSLAGSEDQPQMSRKQKRKEERKLKKAKKNAFHSHAPIPKSMKDLRPPSPQKETKVKNTAEKKARKEKPTGKQKVTKLEKDGDGRQEKEWKKQALVIENKREDKLIKQLEKDLKMKKRKKKGGSSSLPKAFTNDGLDYLLDAVDDNKLKGVYDQEEESDLDLGLDSGSDQDVSMSEDESEDSADLYEESPTDPSDSSKDEDAAMFMEVLQGKKGSKTKQVRFLEENPDEDSDDEIHKGKKGTDKKVKKKEKSPKNPSEKDSKRTSDKFSVGEVGKTQLTQTDVGQKSKKDKKKMTKSVRFSVEKGQSDGDNDEHSKDKCVGKESNVTHISGKVQKVRSQSHSEESSEDEGEIFVDEGGSEEELETGSEDEDSGSEDTDSEDVSDDEDEPKPKLREDIYGRLVDAEGNVYKESEVMGGSGAYVPPAKRLAMSQGSEKKKIELERLKKQLKGLVNRVSESNMQGICGQIGQLYLHHSRADTNECLAEILMVNCISPVLVPERLGLELAMMVAALHSNVGTEVGAFFLQELARKFDKHFNSGGNYGDGKEMDNILTMICHLYSFKVFHSLLMFDIVKKLTDSFQEKDIELILCLLKNVGFGLRKNDPAGLKDIILQIQTKANTTDMEQFEDKSRVKFMLEVLLAIRNNNMRKIPNYDPSHLEHLKKLLRGYIKGSSTAESELRISLNDLVNAESKGRWWVVGSSWVGREGEKTDNTSSQPSVAAENFSMEILELARKQRMNTDVRRTIFCVLMTSEDFVDAFEKLLRLSLKHQQEREIIHVMMECCLQEKVFNPYYAYLAQKFCEYERRFQMTIQFHLWDKLKILHSLSRNQTANLAKFLVHLFSTKALSLSVLKVIEFGEMDKVMVRFLRLVLMGLLVDHADYTVKDVFLRIAPFPKLHVLREGLKLFMHHFILKNKDKYPIGTVDIGERVKIAEAALKSGETKLRM